MWMGGFVFGDASEAPRMDARARARALNARASAMDDRRRARAFAFDRRRWCAREDDEGERRRRTGEEKNICVSASRAREGETRRGIEETRD